MEGKKSYESPEFEVADIRSDDGGGVLLASEVTPDGQFGVEGYGNDGNWW